MISDNVLNCLVNQVDRIVELASKYELNELSLLQPRYDDERSKLYFVISRQENWLLSDETAKFKRSLYDLLGIEIYSDDAPIDVREAFKKEYFIETYGSFLPIFSSAAGSIPCKDLVDFIKKELGFINYTPALSGREQEINVSEASLSTHKHAAETLQQEKSPKKAKLFSSSDAASKIEEESEEEIKNTMIQREIVSLSSTQVEDLEEKSSAASPLPVSFIINQPLPRTLFASSGRQERTHTNILSLEQQQAARQAAQILEREIEKNPGCYDAMLACVEEELERKRLTQHDQVRVHQIAAN